METERHAAGHSYEARFPGLVSYAKFEGGTVVLAGQSSPCHVILDEGGLADFMDDDDELIAIHTFEDPAERAEWLHARFPKSKGQADERST